MNLLRNLALAAICTLPSTVTAQDACAPGETKIIVSLTTSLMGHPKGQTALAVAEQVNAQMDGRLCVEVYGSSELYNDDDVLEAILRNDVQMAAPSLSKFGEYTDRLQMFDLPFLFDGPTEVIDFFATPEAQSLLGDVADDGFTALGFWSNGMRNISATKPLRVPEDASGLTFRVEPSDVLSRQKEMIGATPLKLPFSRVYEALETGEVQGQENTWSNIYTREFFTLQDGVTESNHSYLGYMVVMGQEFLASLPAADREQFLAIVELTTHEYNRFAFETNQISRQNILDEGGFIRRLSDEERELWREAFAELYDEFEPIIGRELMNAAMNAGAKN